MERCEMCEAPTPRLYETVHRHPDAAAVRGFFWQTSLTCEACGDECAPEAEPFYRGHWARELLAGHAIEEMSEHWDTTGDPSEDGGRVPPSQSLWTEPRWAAGDLDMELVHLARCLRYWLTHEPQSYDPAEPASLSGVRRRAVLCQYDPSGYDPTTGLEPLTPAELCEVLGIVEPEQVAVVEKLATSRWYEPRTGVDWYRG